MLLLSFQIESCREAQRSSLPFQPTNFSQPVKLAFPSARGFSPGPFAPGPPLRRLPILAFSSPTPRGREPGAGLRPPTAALCPGPGRPRSPTAALGMLRGGRGGRFASQALALGGGRARGCSWSSSARSWSCREFPPHPSLSARGSGSRRGSRERRRASTRAGQALSGARSPARGSPRGGALPAGTRATHWHCPGSSPAAR